MDLVSFSIFVGYIALKAGAYSGWSVRGVSQFRPEHAHRVRLGIGLGFLRLGLGAVFGVGIFLAGAFVFAGLTESFDMLPMSSMTLTYLAVYVPVRWIEWAIIEALLTRDARSLQGFLLGSSSTGRRWRVGGILISCVADVPLMIAAGGLPVGRFMC